MGAAFVLLYLDLTSSSWTLSYVVEKCKALEGACLLVIAPTALVPRLMALKASLMTAIGAFNFVASFLLFDFFFTGNVWAPDHVWIEIDLAGESNPRKTRSLFFI